MLIKILVGLLAMVLGVFAVGIMVVLQGGVGSVYVENEDITLWLPIPMGVVDLALCFVPACELNDIREEMAPFTPPLLVVFEEFAASPDFVLVNVETAEETVSLQKEGKDLVVDIRSAAEGDVHVEVPIHSLERILRHLTTEPKQDRQHQAAL